MRAREKRKPRNRHRSPRRPFLIDAEDFDFMDDHEMHDWMYGNPAEAADKV